MTPEQWQRVRPILESALELDSAHRTAYLDRACADQSLRSEVESLIAVHEQAGTGLLNSAATPDFFAGDEARFRLPPGKRTGAYEILEEIAVGGMGAVYRAIRADGQYKQQVALKIVRSELGTELTATRFKNERQILATLNHPNIARILDGGTTDEGMPYFVMELVEGQRIDQYCDAHKLATNERLALFLQVCSAVQYAHQRLIIHRDIKPGNILVTAEGVPKLLDFGIAKILESNEATGQPEQTISLIRLLTPEYASPEQVKGEPITTASDIYSLGVVLYELLTGRTPYNVPTHTPHEISRAVCEAEPEKPSTAVRRKQLPAGNGESKGTDDSALSTVREGSPEKLSKRLSGDLDNIVLMALRKEPQRRYASVEQFAQDIRRHLDHLPVLARKDTFGYRTSKFVTRHKVGVAVAALVTVALLSATGVTLRQARIARANALRAERRFNDVRKIANSLLFDVHDSIQALEGATSARKLIVQLGLEYLDDLSAESAADPGLEKELAAAYQKLGDIQTGTTLGNVGDRAGGIASYRKAVKLREELSRQFPRDWAIQNDLVKTYVALGRGLLVVGAQVESNEYLEKAFQIARPLSEQHPDNPSLLYTLGSIEWHRASSLWRLAETEAALRAFRESAETFSRVTTLEPTNTRARRSVAVADKSAGGTLEELQKLDEALHSYRQAFNIDQELLAREPESAMYLRDSTVDLRNLGDVLVKQKRLNEARKYYTNAMAIDKRLVERDPADRDTQFYLALDHEGIGKVFLEMRDASAAIASFQTSQKIHQERTKADPADADAKDSLANNYVLIGEAYAALAQSAPQSLRSAYLQNGCTAYNGALSIWNAMQTAGALNKLSETHRSSLLAKIQNCN
jgi:eukaryotic-like serine/threonine-protein kinase